MLWDGLSVLFCWGIHSVKASLHHWTQHWDDYLLCVCVFYYWFHVNSKIWSSCYLKIGCLMWLLRLVWDEQTGVSGRALCLLCSSMCGALPARGSVESLWTDSGSRRVSTLSSRLQEMNLCARPFLAAVFMRRRRHYGCIWRDICHWMKVYFPLQSTFVEQMEMYRWVLFMFACSTLFSSTHLPLHRAVDDVQIVSVLKCHHMAQRESLSLENLVCNVCFI